MAFRSRLRTQPVCNSLDWRRRWPAGMHGQVVGVPVYLRAEWLHEMAGFQFFGDQRQADQRDAMPSDGRLYGVAFIGKA